VEASLFARLASQRVPGAFLHPHPLNPAFVHVMAADEDSDPAAAHVVVPETAHGPSPVRRHASYLDVLLATDDRIEVDSTNPERHAREPRTVVGHDAGDCRLDLKMHSNSDRCPRVRLWLP